MKLCKLSDVKYGHFFKLADKNCSHHRLYLKAFPYSVDVIVCIIPGTCHQFSFSPDTEVFAYSPEEGIEDQRLRIRRKHKIKENEDV